MSESVDQGVENNSQSERRDVAVVNVSVNVAVAIGQKATANGTTLKVLTLNAWGIKLPWPLRIFESKDRDFRMKAIADALRTSDYDIVALQEVWSIDDYEMIRQRVEETFPDSFYFHSGLVGSGVCVFTKGKIDFTTMHRYSLNGYPHRVNHGDWFGGKVVGLVCINLAGLKIDLYSTHLHAEYNKEKDMYIAHRVLQAYELSQFVNKTTSGDVAIVMGDMNLEPTDFGYQLIVDCARLKDAHVEANPGVVGGTCDVPTNCYSIPATLAHWPQGKRLDYILYRSNNGYKVTATECATPLGVIPNSPGINYSDHEAVCAVLRVERADDNDEGGRTRGNHPKFPEEALHVIKRGIDASISNRRMYMAALTILFIFYILTIDIEVQFQRRLFTLAALAARFVLTLVIGFCFFHGLVGVTMELKAYEAAKAGMAILRRDAQ